MKYSNQYGEMISIAQADEVWLNDDFFAREMAKLPSDAPRAGLAYRVSTKGQVDHDDIPMQKIECRKFCAQQGWRVVLEKAEKGISGSKVSASKRDAIQELKAEAEKGGFEVLLVFMFDRLGRIESETPYVVEWFIKHGVRVWSTREGEQRIDSHTDKLINYIRFWQAAGESEKTAERVATRIRQINASGHYSGGTVPYGYRIVNKGRVNKKNQPVKDLEIDPDEAEVVQELFMRVANEGYSSYALASMLESRGLSTHSGARFTSTHVLRILRHEGYTGYIITKSVRSEHIQELQIIDKELFEQVGKVIDARCVKNAETRRVAAKAENHTLLAGIVYCAHCGARMSGFMHNDRYKRSDGTMTERMRPKYNCFQRAQRTRECDGQALYLAERVDGIVLAVVRELFDSICREPHDKLLEQKIRQECNTKKKQKAQAEKTMRECERALERYEDEVLKCLEGRSKFSQDMLSRLIAKTEGELQNTRREYAMITAQLEDEKEIANRIRMCYNQFCGWAEEFEMASLTRKRMILSQLIDKVEVGRGYDVTVRLNMSYRQLANLAKNDKNSGITQAGAKREKVA